MFAAGVVLLCLACLVVGHFHGFANAEKAFEADTAELRAKLKTYESEALAKVPAHAAIV